MKKILLLTVLVCTLLNSNAQIGFSPGDGFFDPIIPNGPITECVDCLYSIKTYPTGLRTGIGFGLAWEVADRIDLITNFGIQVWKYEVKNFGVGYTSVWPISSQSAGLVQLSQTEKVEAVFNASIGQRFHFIKKERSSFFFGTNLNAQYNPFATSKTFALSIEPAIGWSKAIRQKGEYFISLGYDKFLTSFESGYSAHPGSAVLNTGFRIIMNKKEL